LSYRWAESKAKEQEKEKVKAVRMELVEPQHLD
jgi:hypothetical protein